jgi:hypothetical protein
VRKGEEPPEYEFPWRPRVPFAFDLLFGRRRSLAHDSGLVVAKNPYPRRFEGFERLPPEGTFVIVINHFNRPGLHPYHCAMVLSFEVARRRQGQPELSWLLTSEWYDARIGPLPVPVWATRWTFSRIDRTYGLIVLPRREQLVMARASSLRRVLAKLTTAPIGIMPEGGGSGRLMEPPAGSGLFLAILAERGYPLYPLGIFEEEDGTLVLRLGEPFGLDLAAGASRQEQDRQAREKTMVAIGRLLPRECRGVYETAIEASFKDSRDSTSST